MEVDIFEGFVFDWVPIKKLILKKIYKGVLKLEFSTCWKSDNVVSKVESTVTGIEKMAIQVGWIDNVIGEIGARRDHFELLAKLNY